MTFCKRSNLLHLNHQRIKSLSKCTVFIMQLHLGNVQLCNVSFSTVDTDPWQQRQQRPFTGSDMFALCEQIFDSLYSLLITKNTVM